MSKIRNFEPKLIDNKDELSFLKVIKNTITIRYMDNFNIIIIGAIIFDHYWCDYNHLNLL